MRKASAIIIAHKMFIVFYMKTLIINSIYNQKLMGEINTIIDKLIRMVLIFQIKVFSYKISVTRKSLTLHGPNSFFRRFSGLNLR